MANDNHPDYQLSQLEKCKPYTVQS